METNILLKNNLKSSGIIIATGFCAGLLYPFFGDEFSDKLAFVNGIAIGVIGGCFISFCEYVVFKIDSRKWSFISLLILKTALYFVFFTLLILAVICFTRSLESGTSFWEYYYGEEFQFFIFRGDFKIILIYCLIVLFIINFTRQINRKIGYGVLLDFIIGRYHKPKEEERIFAFIDLKESTRIAEKIGALKFHILLREFFHDISGSILATKGETYRYVGDEMVISWKKKQGLSNSNCVRTYFYMKRELKKQREKYINLFGFVPDFHAALHLGKVIRGEIGDIKSQFVFHGEALFVASKIENECSKSGYDLLISSELIQQLSVPIIYDMHHVGMLKGNNSTGLYTVIEKKSIT